MLDGGQPDGGILERVPLAGRAPCRVHLEGRGRAGRHRARHFLEGGGHRPDVRSDDVLHQQAGSAPAGQAGGDLLSAQRVRERNRGVGRARVGDVRQHRDGGVARQEDVVQVAGAVHAVELVGVGAAGGQHGEHELGRLRGVLHPRAGRDHMVGVDVEDELRTGQGLPAGGGVLRRRHVEPAAPAPCRPRLRVRRRRSGAAGELEDGERRRYGPGALQEAAPIQPGPARCVLDGLPNQLVDRAVLFALGGWDELPIGDGPGDDGQLVVRNVAQVARERADASHAGRIRPASAGLKGPLGPVFVRSQ